jgi:hypothetical protein
MGAGCLRLLHLSVAVKALSDFKFDFIQRHWILLLSAHLLIYTRGELERVEDEWAAGKGV